MRIRVVYWWVYVVFLTLLPLMVLPAGLAIRHIRVTLGTVLGAGDLLLVGLAVGGSAFGGVITSLFTGELLHRLSERKKAWLHASHGLLFILLLGSVAFYFLSGGSPTSADKAARKDVLDPDAVAWISIGIFSAMLVNAILCVHWTEE